MKEAASIIIKNADSGVGSPGLNLGILLLGCGSLSARLGHISVLLLPHL